MGNVADPRDDAIMDLRIARTYTHQSFMADGVIDQNEERALILLDSATGTISVFRLREKAADAFKKVGVNKYVRGLFMDADAALSAMPSNVIPFPNQLPQDVG